MVTPYWNAEQARSRVRDRIDWIRAVGQRPKPVPQVPLLMRLKRRARTALLCLPVVGPWLLTRLQALKGWITRQEGQKGPP